jgi:hypothetical protein
MVLRKKHVKLVADESPWGGEAAVVVPAGSLRDVAMIPVDMVAEVAEAAEATRRPWPAVARIPEEEGAVMGGLLGVA